MPEEKTADHRWLRFLPIAVRKRIEDRAELQRVIDNAGWLVGDRLLRMGIGLIVGVWTARYLGPSGYGMLSYAVSFVGLFFAFAALGLEAIVIRELVRTPEQKEQILGSAFLLRLFGGLLSAWLAVGIISLLRPGEQELRLLVVITSLHLLLQAFEVIDLWFQSKVKSRSVVLAKNAAFLVMAAVRMVFLVQGAPLVAFAIANIAEIAFGCLGLLLAYQRDSGSVLAWRYCYERARTMLKDGFPLILSSIMLLIYLRIDQVMLGSMRGEREVGLYAAAVKLAEVWNVIPTVIISSVFPNIIKAREGDQQEFFGRLQKLYNLLAFCGYAIAIPFTVLAQLVVSLLYGKDFAEAGPMLLVLVWAGLFANLSAARNAYLLAMGWSKILLVLVAAGAFTNVLLNLFFIPLWGGMGAALASLVSYWVVAHGGCYLYSPLHQAGRMVSHALVRPRFW